MQSTGQQTDMDGARLVQLEMPSSQIEMPPSQLGMQPFHASLSPIDPPIDPPHLSLSQTQTIEMESPDWRNSPTPSPIRTKRRLFCTPEPATMRADPVCPAAPSKKRRRIEYP